MGNNPYLATKLKPFGSTIFTAINELAAKHDAINLAQGFPNFPGPDFIKEAAKNSITNDNNQYSPMEGVLELRIAISEKYSRHYDLKFNPHTQVSIFSGCTEAIFATCMGLLNPGDEVILFEPFYDSYLASISMAGAVARAVPLKFPDYEIDFDMLEGLINNSTRAILLNTPHNPTGKVFSLRELEKLAEIIQRHDLLCISDEVYEYLTFDNRLHHPIISIDGMATRTVILNSTGKTFSLTGWKIGYAVGDHRIIECIRRSHQFITFCTATPLQHGMIPAMEADDSYYNDFRTFYNDRRNRMYNILSQAGFIVRPPQGTYFILADFTPFGFKDDVEFAIYLAKEIGVAAIPPNGFYLNLELGKNLIRFCFCKTEAVMQDVQDRFEKLTIVS